MSDSKFFEDQDLPAAEEKLEKSPEVEKYLISFDTPDEDVLLYNSEGCDLFWDSDNFRELHEDSIRELTPINKSRYMIAYGEWRFERDHRADPVPKDITVTGRFASATERLKVRNKKPNMDYLWEKPDKIRERTYQGYRVSDDPDLDTFGRTANGTHTVGIQGQDEFVLMEIPKEIRDKQQRALGEKSRQRADSVEKRGANDITTSGGIVYDPTQSSNADDVNRKFS